MNLLRVLPLGAAVALLSSCATERFTKIRVSNYRDEVISEWVARGKIREVERGYVITAVERHSGPPYRTLTRYPDGWPTTVTGPNIWHWRCAKPAWLAELEDGAQSATGSFKTTVGPS